MLRAELLQWNTPENRFDVTSDMDLIAGESPCSDPWLDYVGKPLIQEITERFSSRVGEASVLQRVQNLGELSTNLVSRLAVDMLSPTIRKSRNGRPGAITTPINRSFPAGSATRHFLQLAAWRGSLATDPLLESFAGHPDTAPEVHRWQYASSHELEGLGSSDAESTRHLAAVEQHRFGRRGNRMRRRFPRAPSASTNGRKSWLDWQTRACSTYDRQRVGRIVHSDLRMRANLDLTAPERRLWALEAIGRAASGRLRVSSPTGVKPTAMPPTSRATLPAVPCANLMP